MMKQTAHRRLPAARQGRLLVRAGVVVLALLVAGTLAACGSGTGGTSGAQPAGPRLVVDPEKIDFGKVQVNNPVTASFRLTNAGDQPLQILGEPVVRVVEGC